jgi:hypothetical protein
MFLYLGHVSQGSSRPACQHVTLSRELPCMLNIAPCGSGGRCCTEPAVIMQCMHSACTHQQQCGMRAADDEAPLVNRDLGHVIAVHCGEAGCACA